MTDVFVSYAHQDRERVQDLVRFLQDQGWTVWWDSNLKGGELFDKAIGEALAAARCVIVVWSHHSVESNFVFDEARRAYERGIAVPLLIDAVEIPLGFGRIQAIPWNGKDASKVAEAVANVLGQKPKVQRPDWRRRRWWIVAAVSAAAAVAVFLFLPGAPSYQKIFLASRPGGDPKLSASSMGMIGLTVWVLRPVKESDPPHARMLLETPEAENPAGVQAEMTPVRVRTDQGLPEGSKVRLSIESSRDGLLYVIDQEQHKDKTAGPPQLVFPTPKTRGSGNFIARGGRLELPVLGSPLKYWVLGQQQKDYAGEIFTVIVSPRPIAELENAAGPSAVDGSLLAQWGRTWGAGAHPVVSNSAGELTTMAESKARADPHWQLTPGDAPPGTIFAVPSKGDAPVLATFRLRVAEASSRSTPRSGVRVIPAGVKSVRNSVYSGSAK